MPHRIPVMNVGESSGGGQLRALVDHIGRLNPVTLEFIAAKTSAYTITNREFGCVFSNGGASGSVTFTLPTPEKGAILLILKVANQTVVLSGTVTGGTAITNSTAASYGGILLIGLDSTTWHPAAAIGTWAIS